MADVLGFLSACAHRVGHSGRSPKGDRSAFMDCIAARAHRSAQIKSDTSKDVSLFCCRVRTKKVAWLAATAA
ncbi:hypothetical protein BURMUCF2_2199 [Burkholderia multivorans CF2]|nr:hypothetical protein BURMUCF2_2199 [Burkholderia multivorans CF2]